MNLRYLIRALEPKLISVHDINFQSRTGAVVFNLNLYALYLLINDCGFVKAFKCADYVHIDGIGASIIVKIITGNYFTPIGYRQWGVRLLRDAVSSGIILIGGTVRENDFAKEVVSERYGVKSVTGINGYASKKEYFELITTNRNKFVVVGLGMPLQELLITELSREGHDKWFFACGGWIKQLGGFESETPRWVSRMKLEWLHRSLGRKNHFTQRVLKPLICILKNF